MGIVNCREYWMNAVTAPETQQSRGDAVSAEDRDRHVVDIRNELHGRLDDAREELGLETRLVQRAIMRVELVDRGVAAPEDLHQLVTGVGLFDQSVEGCRYFATGLAKWRWERLAIHIVTTSAKGIVTILTDASSGEIQIIMPSTPTMVSADVMSWLSPCWMVVVRLSMSLVTRLSTSP